MVEAKAPIQSEVEPALCLGRTAGDMAGVTPEVEVLHAFPVNPTRLWPPPRLCCRTCSPKETGATLRTEQVRIVYEIVLLVFGDDRFRPSSRRRGQLRGNLDGSRRRGGVPAISWASRRSDIRMDVEAAAAVAPERDKPVRCHIVAGQPFEAVVHRNRKFADSPLEGAVSSEPVSGPYSLFIRESTGNFVELRCQHPIRRQK